MTVNLSLTPVLPPLGTATSGALAATPFRRPTAANVPKEFEAVVLQSFIQEMLPKNAETVFGGGVSGDIWRSMLAEKLAAEVASRGGIGIAEMIRTAGPAATSMATGNPIQALSAALNAERS